jgi:hypothetical protein
MHFSPSNLSIEPSAIRKQIVVILFSIGVVAGSIYMGNSVVASPDFALAFLAGTIPVLIALWIILRGKVDRQFLLKTFLLGLGIRWALGFLIYNRHWQYFFGADSSTYDGFGSLLCQSWKGLIPYSSHWAGSFAESHGSGWGMFYFVGGVYYLIGQNQFALQLIIGALGASTCVIVYKICETISPNPKVARMATILTALSPSMVLWSSQLLKDAPIVFCLSLCMLYTSRLRTKFDPRSFALLLLSLFCLFTLRYYVFYIVFVAVAGTLIFTSAKLTPMRMIQGGVLVIGVGLIMSYAGAASNISGSTVNLKALQQARVWDAQAANSGYGSDVDITDPKAALAYLPVGILYMLFAPFPWMINNLRQLITLPELLAWWVLAPLCARGLWVAFRNRLRESFAIIFFTVGLLLAYALFQTDVGTAYRHRAQLFVFLFIFVSLGWEQWHGKRTRPLDTLVRRPPGVMPASLPISGGDPRWGGGSAQNPA